MPDENVIEGEYRELPHHLSKKARRTRDRLARIHRYQSRGAGRWKRMGRFRPRRGWKKSGSYAQRHYTGTKLPSTRVEPNFQSPKAPPQPSERVLRTRRRLAEIQETQARQVGRRAGVGTRKFGRGLVEAAKGFKEGLDFHPTARGTGRAAGKTVKYIGQGVKGAAQFVGDLEPRQTETGTALKGGSYWFGSGSKSQSSKPKSKLPVHEQKEIVKNLIDMYPQVYQKLYYEGITYSEVVGTIRDNLPDLYRELRRFTGYGSGTSAYAYDDYFV